MAIIEKQGRYLLQHRDDIPTIRYPGMWSLFGGRVETGESPSDGVIRELFEELAWRPSSVTEFRSYDDRDVDSRVRHIFVAKLDVEIEQLTLLEGQGMALWSPKEWDGLALVPRHRQILDDYLVDRDR